MNIYEIQAALTLEIKVRVMMEWNDFFQRFGESRSIRSRVPEWLAFFMEEWEQEMPMADLEWEVILYTEEIEI